MWRDMEEFDTSDRGAHDHWPKRFFARIVDKHLEQTGNRGGRIGDAESYVLDSRGLFEAASRTMKAVAADPHCRL